MKNTRVSYMYRDANNYKYYAHVVVAGELRYDEIASYLDDGEHFIVGEISEHWEEPQYQAEGFPTTDDHTWCEIEREDVELTDEEPTVPESAAEVVQRFKSAHSHQWNVEHNMKRMGLA